MESHALEDKIVDLEIRLSHQDDMLLSLNDVIISQQKQIALLEKQVQHLGLQMTAVRQSEPGSMVEDSPPPHYWSNFRKTPWFLPNLIYPLLILTKLGGLTVFYTN